MKNYTIEEIERLMKEKKPIDMKRVSMETLNPIAWKYCKDLEKGEKFGRETFLKVVNDNTLDTKDRLDLALKALQVLDFSKQSKEGVLFNFQQAEQRFKQYNAMLENEKEKKS